MVRFVLTFLLFLALCLAFFLVCIMLVFFGVGFALFLVASRL